MLICRGFQAVNFLFNIMQDPANLKSLKMGRLEIKGLPKGAKIILAKQLFQPQSHAVHKRSQEASFCKVLKVARFASPNQFTYSTGDR